MLTRKRPQRRRLYRQNLGREDYLEANSQSVDACAHASGYYEDVNAIAQCHMQETRMKKAINRRVGYSAFAALTPLDVTRDEIPAPLLMALQYL